VSAKRQLGVAFVLCAVVGCQPSPVDQAPQPASSSAWDGQLLRTWRLPSPLGTPLTVDAVEPYGPALVVSNRPELVRLGGEAGLCLVKAKPKTGRFRLFVHHQAALDGGPVVFQIAIRNLSAQPIDLYAGANSVGLPSPPEVADWLATEPADLGYRAVAAFLRDRVAKRPDQWLATVKGEPYRLLAQAEPGLSWSAMIEFGVRFAGGGDRAPNVELGVYVSRSAAWPSAAWPQAVPTSADERRCRGLFGHADRRVTVRCTWDGKPHWIDLGGPLDGPFARPLPAEYATNQLDGEGPDLGNYGVVYDLEATIVNPGPDAARAHLLMSAAGGPSGLALGRLDDGQVDTWPDLAAYETVRFASVVAPAQATGAARLCWSLPGGGSGAHRLFIWPDTLLPPG